MKLTMNTLSQYSVYVARRDAGGSTGDDYIIGQSELNVDLTKYLTPNNKGFILLKPYTTTFVIFRVNRDPTLDEKGEPPLIKSFK